MYRAEGAGTENIGTGAGGAGGGAAPRGDPAGRTSHPVPAVEKHAQAIGHLGEEVVRQLGEDCAYSTFPPKLT